MRPDIVTGIDLGTESLKAVALECVRGEANPRVLGSSIVSSRGIRKGSVVNSEELSLEIKKLIGNLESSIGVKAPNMFVGVGGLGVGFQKAKGLVAISRADNEVSREDVKRALAASEGNLQRIQNKAILHNFPIQYSIDNETITHDPVGLTGLKLEATSLFVTLFVQQSKGAVKAFDDMEQEIIDLTAGPVGLSHAVLTGREKEAGVMLLDIGASTTSIILFEEGLPYSLEVLPYGSMNITHDIAVGFQMPIVDAEKLKVGFGAVSSAAQQGSSKKSDSIYGNYSKKKLTDIVEARLGDIFELVEKHLKKVDRVGLLPAGIVIAGGCSNLPGVADFAKECLKLPARVSELPDLGGYKDKIREPEWFTALGVALMAIESQNGSAKSFRGVLSPLLRWFQTFLP